MKDLKYYRFADGELKEVTAIDPNDGCSYLIVKIVDGIPVSSLIV